MTAPLTLLPIASALASVLLALAMVCAAWRMLRGPAAQDRILGLDTFYVNGMLLVLTLGLRFGSRTYFEVALIAALFAFVGTVALAKFLLRGEVIEP